jgi:hypothetical protein
VYFTARIWKQPHTSAVIHVNDTYSVKVTFWMILFSTPLDEDCQFCKTQTHTQRCQSLWKKAYCLNSKQFILCSIWACAINTMLINAVLFVIRYHCRAFPLTVIKSENKFRWNMEFLYDIFNNCFLRQWRVYLLQCVHWTRPRISATCPHNRLSWTISCRRPRWVFLACTHNGVTDFWLPALNFCRWKCEKSGARSSSNLVSIKVSVRVTARVCVCVCALRYLWGLLRLSMSVCEH